MKRREFMALFGGAALAWPLSARAQRGELVRRIGFLLGLAESDPEGQARITAFRRGLEARGWTEGRNIRIDYRFAGGDPDRVRSYAAELVALAPDLIVAHSAPVVAALKQATGTIPIVFVVVNDPVGLALIASLANPGGNITGFTFVDFEMIGKWLELIKEIAPNVVRAGLMFNPDVAPYFHVYLREFGAVPTSLAVEITAVPVHDATEIEAAITRLGRVPDGGLIVAPDPFTVVNREVIMRSAELHRLPTVCALRQAAAEGMLMSYGPDASDIFRRSASYVDRILKGAKPADLPVQAPTKFELAINLKIAKALQAAAAPLRSAMNSRRFIGARLCAPAAHAQLAANPSNLEDNIPPIHVAEIVKSVLYDLQQRRRRGAGLKDP
jgi:putative ABC transport system substrate-binding protein